MKDERPSGANGNPKTSPKGPIRPGQRSPKFEVQHRPGDRADRERTALTFSHFFASPSATVSPRKAARR